MVLHLETPHGLRSKETDFLLDEVLKTIPVVLEEPTTGTMFVNEGGGTFVGRPEEDLLLELNFDGPASGPAERRPSGKRG